MSQYDFVMTVIRQIVFSLFDEFPKVWEQTEDAYFTWDYGIKDNPYIKRLESFCTKCLHLANENFLGSLNLNPQEYLDQ